MGVDRYPAKCTFCGNDKLTFSIKEGKKVLDKPCECKESKSYFSKEAIANRALAQEKELKRLGIEV